MAIAVNSTGTSHACHKVDGFSVGAIHNAANISQMIGSRKRRIAARHTNNSTR
jgi:hypothetical protein